jgi:ProP effector
MSAIPFQWSFQLFVERQQTAQSGYDEANALLDEALAEAQARSAKNEALQRAYASSGKSVDAFADMYGLDPQAVARLLAR